MQNKTLLNKTLYIIFMAIISLSCFCAALIAPILAKFVAEEDMSFNEDFELDYTVSNVFLVENQEDLFAAINNGYSYIQLSKDIENPLIITQSTTDLNEDLILDLNGIEIQRNGHEPILNIKSGVRLTVTDTSKEQTGGLYNPVGSVFNVTGGTLTVVTGKFESGPRYSEYYSYNGKILDNRNNSTTNRTLVEQDMQKVTYYKNEKNGNTVTTTKTENKLAPIIKSYPVTTGEVKYVYGNLYFDQELRKGNGANAFTIKPDTYCYYQTSEKLTGVQSTKMADWFYTYYVTANTYTYVSETKPTTGNDSDYIQITIYGYENTIGGAKAIPNAADYYAAIQMQSGELSVQTGKFNSYFGVDTTACVNAQGGTIDIGKGDFSSRIPNATSATNNSVTKKETDSAAFNDSYFNNFIWNSSSPAVSGESYCILNGGTATVTIDQGKFYSSNNNLINMSGGTLSIGSVAQANTNTFTKNTTIQPGATSQKTAAIHMESGNISVSKSSFDVDGDYTYGIHLLNGEITVADGTFTVDGNSTHGILCETGTIDVSGGSFTVSGDSSHGIHSQGGNITLATGTISIEGTKSYGVRAKGEVKITNGTITLNDSESYGIYAESGNVTFDTGNIRLYGASSHGINSQGGKVTFEDGTISLSGANSYGVSSKGEVSIADGKITLTGNSSRGIYSDGGNITFSATEKSAEKGVISLTGTNSYGVYSSDGDVSITNGSISLTSYQSCYGVYALSPVTLTNASIDVGYNSTGSRSGTVDASIGVYATAAVTMTGTDVSCYEIGLAVNGGSLNISGAGKSILTKKASAIVVTGGNLTFDESSSYTVTSYNTVNNSTTNSYNLTLPDDSAYPNLDGIYVSGGMFTSNGNLNLTHTGLKNKTEVRGTKLSMNTDESLITAQSYAVRVLNGNATIKKAQIRAIQGGGLRVSGGSVYFGYEGMSDTEISITTEGKEYNDYLNYFTDSWRYCLSKNGGDAVYVTDGSATIYGGTYKAENGNGIWVRGNNNTEVTVSGGKFYGYYVDNPNLSNGANSNQSYYNRYEWHFGVYSHSGLKITHGGTVNVSGGYFEGANGGMILRGSSNNSIVTARVTGTLKNGNYSTIFKMQADVEGGQDGVTVFDYSTLYLGVENNVNLSNGIQIIGEGCSIAINTIGGNYSRKVYVYGGNYPQGIWRNSTSGLTLINPNNVTIK